MTARRGSTWGPREVREVRAAQSAHLWERACAGNRASRASLCIARVVPRAPLPRGVTNRHTTRPANAPTARDHRAPPRGVPGQPPAPRHPGECAIPPLDGQHRAATPGRHVIQRERPQSEPGIPQDPPSGLRPPSPRSRATSAPSGNQPTPTRAAHAYPTVPRGEVTPVLWIAFVLVFAGFLAVHALDRHRRRTNR